MIIKSFFMILSASVCISCAWSSQAQETNTQLDSLNQEVATLAGQGQHARAIALATQAIETARNTFGQSHIQVARSHFRLAELYWAQKQHRQAEGPYKLALWMFEQTLPPADPETARTLNKLVDNYSAQEQWQQANVLLLHWRDVTEQALGSNTPQTAQAIKDLAEFYRQTHREHEARKLEQLITNMKPSSPQENIIR